MGIIPLLKGRMRGGGMQPLRIIRPIYCRDKPQTGIKEERKLWDRRSLWPLQLILSSVVKVVVNVLYTQDLLI